MQSYLRDEVFVPGGQPTVTYVERSSQNVERALARTIATPNQIASLSGPTKTGKTVLCKKVLGEREYVWIDGGRIHSAESFWENVKAELDFPIETSTTHVAQTTITSTIKFVLTAGGSRLASTGETKKWRLDSLSHVLETMIQDKIILVIDDFHYIPDSARTDIMRNLKGAVFNGLKIVLLSVSHRVFDAIQAESELTGRFAAIVLPEWTKEDLRQIPLKGFESLKTTCSSSIIDRLCDEAQNNPTLMQRFCWEICFDSQIERTTTLFASHQINETYDLDIMFIRVAQDAGLPIFRKLKAGPQSRKIREKRPLRLGGYADVYEIILQAIAQTGPKSTIPYDEIKSAIATLLSDHIPQKHEITAALKQLVKISRKEEADSAIDWDEHGRHITVADPYLRFYLRWQVRENGDNL